MHISVACPGCKTRYSIPDAVAGKLARCNKCDQSFRVPVLETDADAWSDELPGPPPRRDVQRSARTQEAEPRNVFSLRSVFSGLSVLVAVAFVGLRLFRAYSRIMDAGNGLPDNPLPAANEQVFNGEPFPVAPAPARLNPGDPVPGSGPRADLPLPARGLYPAGTVPAVLPTPPSMDRAGLTTRHSVQLTLGLEEIDQLSHLLEGITDEASLEKARPELTRLTQDPQDIHERIIKSLPALRPDENDELARRTSAKAQKTITALQQQFERLQAIPTLAVWGHELESSISKLTGGYRNLIQRANQLEPEPQSYIEVFINNVPDPYTCSKIARLLVKGTSSPSLGGQEFVWGDGVDSAFRVWTVYDPRDFATRLFPPPARFVVKNHQIFVNNYQANPASMALQEIQGEDQGTPAQLPSQVETNPDGN